ncbi:zinc-dependent alcohol dehydrogenase [Qipengyuania qiaonensis]|uniref:Alcohol dehydrogenase catalytic domain-containing protein n=1 Tax=Qipengyuania qiaonensis TaxID=2867240 RepID=A0ABS7J494_9SPHN|nr:alcohol dehydrogenase catalytic domain-containing protein [Qipengyuania qiaonensis]MBX7482152.1 alcohol dehydrogenase catalytic domain-containing protein [Qipengyuania qiaonensis]
MSRRPNLPVAIMQQLNFIGPRALQWRDVPPPVLDDPKSVLVRPLTVSTCDMDGVVIQGLLPLKGPVPLGHEGEGVIIEAGGEVTRWRVGDRVIIPWKIACGHCKSCGRGHSAQCLTVPPEDAYGWGPTAPHWGGFLSDVVLVPFADTMLTRLPDGIDPVLACGVADNISDGWRAVGPALRERPGGTVLVAGMVPPGSIGLYAAGIAVALGSERVVYADHDQRRLEIAGKMGAEPLQLGPNSLESLRLGGGLDGGFDVTVDASGSPEILQSLIRLTARAGVCVSTAGIVYRGRDPQLPVYEMYRKSMTFSTGWVHTHSLIDDPLDLIASGRFDPRPVITRVVPWEEAHAALAEPFTKLIVSREA